MEGKECVRETGEEGEKDLWIGEEMSKNSKGYRSML